MPSKSEKAVYFEKILVTDAAATGKGIGKAPDGRVIFLPHVAPGDVVDVRITKKRSAYYEGLVVTLHHPSDKRTIPVCEHFGVCGGCTWQHLAYQHQLTYKQKEVENNLLRIGKVQLPPVSPIIGARKTYFYRNKMEFSFSDNRWLTSAERQTENLAGNRNALGFHIPRMWDKVLDLNHCYLQEAPSDAIRLAIKKIALQHGFSFFNLRRREGLLRSLIIRTTSVGESMVVLQFFEDDAPKRELLLNSLLAEFPQLTSLQYVINPKPNDTLYDQEVICYAGRDYIVEKMEELVFRIHAKSFYQTHSEQAYNLYKIVRDFAALSGAEKVYDLYTGTGTIALFLAKQAGSVTGVESVPEAVADARANARRNGIANVFFVAGDMKSVFTNAFIAQHGKPDVVITDPPRDGMHPEVVKQLISSAPEKIVYVSCNSATQARDLALMSDAYALTRVQPIDLFPQTYHVENVVLLERR